MADAPPAGWTPPSWKDWRYDYKVSRVRYQGPCGSCWAFTIIAYLESMYSIMMQTRTIPNLSEQFLVSCDTKNWGCYGGNTANALEYLKDTTGLWYEGEFKYDENDFNKPCTISYPTRNLGFPKLNGNKAWL